MAGSREEMSCDAYQELLSAYADGALTPAERERVESHLEGCPACRDSLRGLEAVKGDVASLLPRRAPEGFKTAVMERIDREASARGRPARAKLFFLRAPFLGAAAAVLTAVLSLYIVHETERGERIAPSAPAPLRHAEEKASGASSSDAAERLSEKGERAQKKGRPAAPAPSMKGAGGGGAAEFSKSDQDEAAAPEAATADRLGFSRETARLSNRAEPVPPPETPAAGPEPALEANEAEALPREGESSLAWVVVLDPGVPAPEDLLARAETQGAAIWSFRNALAAAGEGAPSYLSLSDSRLRHTLQEAEDQARIEGPGRVKPVSTEASSGGKAEGETSRKATPVNAKQAVTGGPAEEQWEYVSFEEARGLPALLDALSRAGVNHFSLGALEPEPPGPATARGTLEKEASASLNAASFRIAGLAGVSAQSQPGPAGSESAAAPPGAGAPADWSAVLPPGWAVKPYSSGGADHRFADLKLLGTAAGAGVKKESAREDGAAKGKDAKGARRIILLYRAPAPEQGR